MFRSVLTSHCIFCAAACHPKFTVIDGSLNRIKSEPDIITPDPIPTPSTSSATLTSFFEEDKMEEEDSPSLLAEQLNSIFILKNILGIKEEKLCQFLGKLGGQFHPEFWLQVCTSCGESVKEYYKTLKGILKLQKKLKGISDELKSHISDTRPRDVYEEDGDGVAAQVWKEVREEVLKEIGNQSQPGGSGGVEEENSTQIFISTSIFADNSDCQEMPQLQKQPSTSEKCQNRRKQKLIPRPPEFLPPPPPPPAPDPPLIIPDNLDIEEVENYSDDEEGTLHIDETYSLGSGSTYSPISLQNQPFPKKISSNSTPTSILRKHNELEFRFDVNLDNVRRYPLPTLSFSECPRFSGVRKGRQQHYECLECSAKSTIWNRFKAHLELHHPSVSAEACEKCGWLVDSDNISRHYVEYHPE